MNFAKAFTDAILNAQRERIVAEEGDKPITVMLFSKDGTLDHHVTAPLRNLAVNGPKGEAIEYQGRIYRANAKATEAMHNTLVYSEVTTITLEDYIAAPSAQATDDEHNDEVA